MRRRNGSAAVQRAAGVDVGDSIVTFLPGSVAGNVRDLPWADTVSVTRDFPNTVRIRVTERLPVAWVKAGKRVIVVDQRSPACCGGPTPRRPVSQNWWAPPTFAAQEEQIRPVVLATVAEAFGPELRSRVTFATLEDGTLDRPGHGRPASALRCPSPDPGQSQSGRGRLAGPGRSRDLYRRHGSRGPGQWVARLNGGNAAEGAANSRSAGAKERSERSGRAKNGSGSPRWGSDKGTMVKSSGLGTHGSGPHCPGKPRGMRRSGDAG